MGWFVLNSRKIYVGYVLILILLFFKSVNASLLWNISHSLVYVIGFIISLLYYTSHAMFLRIGKFDVFLLFLFFLIKCYTVYQGVLPQYMLFAFCGILPILLLLVEETEIKVAIFNTIVTVFCGILFLSLIGWILFLTGVDLPNVSTSWQGQYEYKNYFLFLYNKGDDNSIFPRFSSIFLEPGHLAMIISFILWIKCRELSKFQLIVLISSVVFSFSLAGYILCSFQLFSYLILDIRRGLVTLLLIAASGLLILNNVELEDSIIDRYILERIQISESKGISGNNRTSDDFDSYYDRLKRTDAILWGVGFDLYKRDFKGGNAGYKVFIVQYGYAGLILTLLLYILYTLKYRSKLMLILFSLYGLAFIQRAYPFWEAWLIPYICSIGFLSNKK